MVSRFLLLGTLTAQAWARACSPTRSPKYIDKLEIYCWFTARALWQQSIESNKWWFQDNFANTAIADSNFLQPEKVYFSMRTSMHHCRGFTLQNYKIYHFILPESQKFLFCHLPASVQPDWQVDRMSQPWWDKLGTGCIIIQHYL